MDVERFGDGAGGTDGNANIRGAHAHEHQGGVGAETNWEGVRKGDTLY